MYNVWLDESDSDLHEDDLSSVYYPAGFLLDGSASIAIHGRLSIVMSTRVSGAAERIFPGDDAQVGERVLATCDARFS